MTGFSVAIQAATPPTAKWAPTPIELRMRGNIRVDANTGCHNWTAVLSRHGYGRIKYTGRSYEAHRLSYELAYGRIPPGLEIDHLCRNRTCVNPAHLEAVTRAENTRRGNSTCGFNARKTHCINGHMFTPENTYLWRGKSRICRACRKARKS